ncbi:hypothetical protein PHLGIDRAFT_22992 [Phlebiopsis gigantea 11061_1 CR5-6]|uniref:Wax synthase domain-containing protein n=1 Tax=Phlebiopsis gigantea (strain 11061_1 CR5-6) TaxID=745531 RepID=A0A0C3NVJ9_PHLG1|nr:hypothetical protein PHLGIDRAFT_22992 [Phlebiopsis gigantea 11061_1 CR5-6]
MTLKFERRHFLLFMTCSSGSLTFQQISTPRFSKAELRISITLSIDSVRIHCKKPGRCSSEHEAGSQAPSGGCGVGDRRGGLVPDPQLRQPLTWSNVPSAFAYQVPHFFMAYLARRRDTQPIRLLLLPTVLAMAIRGTYYYDWFEPKYYFFTWVRALLGITVAVQSIDMALSPQGRLKIGETSLPSLYEESSTSAPNVHKSASGVLPPWSLEAWDVTFSLRGIGWKFGKGVSVPKDTRPQERGPFLKAASISFLKNYLTLDIVVAILQLMPGIGSTAGGSMFYSNLPLAPRLLVSTLITLISGAAMTAGFETLYALGTLLGVGLLGQSPSAWPPLTSNPFAAESISEFWAKRWHQTLRRTFLVMGGIPAGRIAGRPGMIIGAFFASGLFHEFGAYALGRGMDHTVTAFFTLQGVAVVLEGLWTSVTGRKVGGWPGRIWAYAFMMPLAQMCLDSWFSRGLAGSLFLPTSISPAKSFIVPVVQQYLAKS